MWTAVSPYLSRKYAIEQFKSLPIEDVIIPKGWYVLYYAKSSACCK